MGRTKSLDSGDLWTIGPQKGTGWEAVVSGTDRQVRMHFKFLGLDLPVRRRIPYSEVVRVATICREAWWSRALTPISGSFGRGVISGGGRPERTVMPSRGWRYDVVMTLKGGQTIKVKTVDSPDAAAGIELQLKRMTGLRPEH